MAPCAPLSGAYQLRQITIQPRHPIFAPARLLHQALCLSHGHSERHETELENSRWPCLLSPLVAQKLWGGYRGWIPLAFALQKSINTVAVRISNKYGRKKIIANLKKAGIKHHLKPTCSMALGDQAVTVLNHTAGYASFANGGFRALPYGVLEIRDSSNNLIYSREKDAKHASVFSNINMLPILSP